MLVFDVRHGFWNYASVVILVPMRHISAMRTCLLLSVFAYFCQTTLVSSASEPWLSAKLSEDGNSILVIRDGAAEPVVTQVARPDFRPYLHPIVAPDGKGQLTEYSPGHHKHQTGLY